MFCLDGGVFVCLRHLVHVSEEVHPGAKFPTKNSNLAWTEYCTGNIP
jgi:hypothetical protein